MNCAIELNDVFRLAPQKWGKLMITRGLQEMARRS